MAFAFTICTVAERDKIAAKRIRPTETIQYAKVTWWRYEPAVEISHVAMAVRLRALALQPTRMIVMGHPADGLDLRQAHRRLWAHPETATLIAPTRAWLPLDFDDVPLPLGLGRAGKLEAAAMHVRDRLLPDEFRNVRMIATPTASTGRKGDSLARLRLFVALDRPHPLSVMKQWARGAAAVLELPVDSSVIQPGQPVYTPRPVFESVNDPVPRGLHAIILDGDRDLAPLVVDRFAVKLAKIEATVERAVKTCGSNWRGLMDTTIGGDEGYFAPLTRSIGYAVRAGAAPHEIEAAAAIILSQRADADRQRQYGAPWIRRTIASFQNRDDTIRAAQQRGLSRLFVKEPRRA